MSREQIEAIKFIISEDAEESAFRYFLYGSLVSFPIGFAASLVASFTLRRFARNPPRLFAFLSRGDLSQPEDYIEQFDEHTEASDSYSEEIHSADEPKK